MISATITTGLVLVVLWVSLFWLFRDYRIDVFRQNMFALRDELFDFASEGKIAFDHPAYRSLRAACNGYIRFGHRVSFITATLFYWSLTESERKWLSENGPDTSWDKITQDLSGPIVRALDSFRHRTMEIVAAQLVLGSPVMILLVATIIPGILLAVAVVLGVEAVKAGWSRLISGMDLAAKMLGQTA